MEASFLAIREQMVFEWRREARAGRLFAILDACDEPAVPPMIRRLGPRRAVCLYRGRAEADLWAIAPYLAECDATLFDWIRSRLWGRPWGVFVIANRSLDDLRTHFRRFLEVTAPDGRRLYFRFYDPRVLRQFVTVGTEPQWRSLLEPVAAFGCPNSSTYGVVRISSGRIYLAARPRRAEAS